MARKHDRMHEETKSIALAPRGYWAYDEEGAGHWIVEVEYTFQEYEKFIRDVKRVLKTFDITIDSMTMENDDFVEIDVFKPPYDTVIRKLNELNPKFMVVFYGDESL